MMIGLNKLSLGKMCNKISLNLRSDLVKRWQHLKKLFLFPKDVRRNIDTFGQIEKFHLNGSKLWAAPLMQSSLWRKTYDCN